MDIPEILQEQESFFAIYKPAGWIVNDASTVKNQPVLQKWLEENVEYEISNDKKLRSGIVHRIDKETSGILLVAKSEKAMKELQSQFKKRTVQKTYLALLHGKLEPEKGDVNAPVGRLPWNRERFGVLPGGRPAETAFSVKEYFTKKSEKFSLVEFYPKTGRTHQIRIHSKYLGHPIVADEFYTGRKTSRKDRKWCPRLFLHAHKITVKDPDMGEKISFTSELPEDLQQALDTLQKD